MFTFPPPASPCVDKKGPNIVETAIMVIIGHSRLPASHTVCAPLSSPCRDRKANISGFLSSGFDFHIWRLVCGVDFVFQCVAMCL